MNYKHFVKRYIIMAAVILVFVVVFFIKLINLQIVNGSKYEEAALIKSSNSSVVKAPRGEILDRYGRPLVTNRMAFSILIDKVKLGKNDLNALLFNLVKIFDKNKTSFGDSLPISFYPYKYTFNFDEKQGSDYNRILKIIKANNLSENASADDIMQTLIKNYAIPSSYDQKTIREVTGMRYEMESRSFSTLNQFVFAQDVDMSLVTQIRENADQFIGTQIDVEPIREYSSSLAAHILGRIGPIYKEDYEELRKKGYAMSDMVGKDGIEKAFENYLKGSDGRKSLDQGSGTSSADTVYSKEPVPGNNVVLTIDKDLQQVAETSLEKTIKSIAATGRASGSYVGSGYDARSGAVVVLDVNSGEVLAMASYPTFNLTTFSQDYKQLSANTAKPMFNRAIAGTYEPGSTFKMLTALAGLESGVINTTETIECKGIYTYYAPTYQPQCWIYTDTGKTHGPVNVEQAITVSCNYFFYETGRRLGIDRLNDYGKKFGFGQYTGLEISGEAKGILAGKEYRDSLNLPWYAGDTLQAAIGQSDNQMTPLQLANYVATLVNGGTRYKVHLLKEVTNYTTGDPVYQSAPQVAEKITISRQAYTAIMNGMRSVTETGTASNVFSDYDIAVGGKTGTAESAPGKSPNGVFVAFAPFDKPQIAIAIVVEQGQHGNYVAPIAKDIFDAYFHPKTDQTAQNQTTAGSNGASNTSSNMGTNSSSAQGSNNSHSNTANGEQNTQQTQNGAQSGTNSQSGAQTQIARSDQGNSNTSTPSQTDTQDAVPAERQDGKENG